MTITDAMKTLLCEAFTTNVDKMSWHTADPGITGANDAGITHATITWDGETDGIDTATVDFNGISGTFTHIGLWDGSTFRQGIECAASYTASVDIAVTLTHDATGQS